MYRLIVLCLALSFSAPTWATPITGHLFGGGYWELTENEAEEPLYDLQFALLYLPGGGYSLTPSITPGDITVGVSETTSTDWIIGTYQFVIDKISMRGSGEWVNFILRGWITDTSQQTFDGSEPTRYVLGISTNPDSYSFTTRVPEPGSLALLSIGLVGLVLMRRKKVYSA